MDRADAPVHHRGRHAKKSLTARIAPAEFGAKPAG